MLRASKIEMDKKRESLLTPLTVINKRRVPTTNGERSSVPPTESVDVPLGFLQRRATRTDSEVVARRKKMP